MPYPYRNSISYRNSIHSTLTYKLAQKCYTLDKNVEFDNNVDTQDVKYGQNVNNPQSVDGPGLVQSIGKPRFRSSLLNTTDQWGKDRAKWLDYFRVERVEGEQFLDEPLGR
jgi:hypothetical protein